MIFSQGSEHLWNTTAYLGFPADHIHPIMARVHHPLMAVSNHLIPVPGNMGSTALGCLPQSPDLNPVGKVGNVMEQENRRPEICRNRVMVSQELQIFHHYFSFCTIILLNEGASEEKTQPAPVSQHCEKGLSENPGSKRNTANYTTRHHTKRP